MNSFRTREESLRAIEAYPELAVDGLPLDFLQARAQAASTTSARRLCRTELEWCPPGTVTSTSR